MSKRLFVAFLLLGLVLPAFGLKHPEFTRSNIMRIRLGMSPEEVVILFGLPDRTESMTAGTKTDEPWQALIYRYDMGPHRLGEYQTISNENYFVFSAEYETLELWDIQLAYPDDYTEVIPAISSDTDTVLLVTLTIGLIAMLVVMIATL